MISVSLSQVSPRSSREIFPLLRHKFHRKTIYYKHKQNLKRLVTILLFCLAFTVAVYHRYAKKR